MFSDPVLPSLIALEVVHVHDMNDLSQTKSEGEMVTSSTDWVTGSKFADSAVDVITPQGHTSSSIAHDFNQGHTGNSIAETESSIQSPSSPNLPADYEDTEDSLPVSNPLPPAATTLSDKLRQLATAVWTLEQDEGMDTSRRKKMSNVVSSLERMMQQEDDQSEFAEDATMQDESESEDDEDYIDEQHLHQVHDSLLSTVHEMRLRTQEQKHLHSLTASKLETATQQYLARTEQVSTMNESLNALHVQIDDAQTECNGLRRENRILGTENDTLQSRNEELKAHMKALEAEVQRQAVALTAMTSAVTGLEEWMNYSSSNRNDQQEPRWQSPQDEQRDRSRGVYRQGSMNGHVNPHAPVKPRTVVRGKGRFRGRYQVDVDDDGEGDIYGHEFVRAQSRFSPHPKRMHDEAYSNGWTPSPDGTAGGGRTSELQDDVRAWIRGCRDVLECAQAGADALPMNLSSRDAISLNESVHDNDDEWGEFETVAHLT